MRKILSVLLLTMAASAASLDVPTSLNFPVETHTLKNGMKVLIHEDHSIPNVALYVFYKIGSRNERPGTTGLSHFFEHMMFNGAKKYGPHMFDREMEGHGGSNNAYTSNDVTVYQDWFPSSALELIFDLEGDRIRDLSFDPKMVASERGVVASERRTSVDNNNNGILFEQFNAAAYIAHPYHWPVVGWMSDIESWTMDDLKAHFSMGYAPNNAVMVVCGNVHSAEFIALAEKYIGTIPPRDPPPPVRTKEPEQLGEKRIRVERIAQLPSVIVGWHVPETASADRSPLTVLSLILTTGQSSRLYQRMVDKDQLVTGVGSGMAVAFDPTLFRINMQMRAGVAPENAEKALYEEIARVQRDGVTDREMQKAKNILLGQLYRGLKTISGQANLLGDYEIFFGDYKKLLDAPSLYEKVTKEDVQRVAEKYLTEKNRTVATLVPTKGEK